MNFTRLNLNPTGREVPDCVVRALMKAHGGSWKTTFLGLCDYALTNFTMPNHKRAYEPWLADRGFKKMPMPRFADNTRYTVKEFIEANPKGTFVVSVAKHLTVVVDGTLFDTWNCCHKSVGNYWRKV